MTLPVTYLEINTADLEATTSFFEQLFGWRHQPFAAPDYLVAPHGDGPGIDTGVLPARDGQARAVPILRVPSIGELRPRIEAAGGTVVVEPFEFPGVGRGCYCTDPTGLLFGLHEYEADRGSVAPQ